MNVLLDEKAIIDKFFEETRIDTIDVSMYEFFDTSYRDAINGMINRMGDAYPLRYYTDVDLEYTRKTFLKIAEVYATMLMPLSNKADDAAGSIIESMGIINDIIKDKDSTAASIIRRAVDKIDNPDD